MTNAHRDAEDRALHALLFEHERGLEAIDVADALGTSVESAQALLDAEARAQRVDLVGIEEGEARWVTLRATPPTASFTEALRELVDLRAARAGARKNRFRLAAAVGLLVAGAIALHALPRRTADATLPVVAASDEATAEHRVAAAMAAWRRAEQAAEADDLARRARELGLAVTAANCDASWRVGRRCYVGGRLASRAEVEVDRAWMAAREAELRRLLE